MVHLGPVHVARDEKERRPCDFVSRPVNLLRSSSPTSTSQLFRRLYAALLCLVIASQPSLATTHRFSCTESNRARRDCVSCTYKLDTCASCQPVLRPGESIKLSSRTITQTASCLSRTAPAAWLSCCSRADKRTAQNGSRAWASRVVLTVLFQVSSGLFFAATILTTCRPSSVL